MAAGYVYILINASMPGLIKVGLTVRNSRARARELQSTGVPTPFQVAFEIFSDDCDALENRLHSELDEFRVAGNREFFRFPLDRAIARLQELAKPPEEPSNEFVAEDILDRLRERYPEWLANDIVGVRIVQTDKRVWLEITTEEEIAGYLVDQTIKRSDLAFIIDGDPKDHDRLMFLPSSTVSENAEKFVGDFDSYSIMVVTELFNDKACKEVPHPNRAEQDGADQPATALESKSEGSEKPKPEEDARPQ